MTPEAAAGLRAHNSGRGFAAWARTAPVWAVNELARHLGVPVGARKAHTVHEIQRSHRPAEVAIGLALLLAGGAGLVSWSRTVRRAELVQLAVEAGAPQGRTKGALLRALREHARTVPIIRRQNRGIEVALKRARRATQRAREGARVALFSELVDTKTVAQRAKAIARYRRRLSTDLFDVMKRHGAEMWGKAGDHVGDLLGIPVKPGKFPTTLAKSTADRIAAVTADELRHASVVMGEGDALEIARRLAGRTQTAITVRRTNRTDTIVRTEIMRTYNEGQVKAAKSANRPTMKRIDEVFDRRNHPFSRAAHGTRAELDAPFRVPAAEVRSHAQGMGKSSTGVFWPLKGGFYVGANLPAHYSDRGRIVIEATTAP